MYSSSFVGGGIPQNQDQNQQPMVYTYVSQPPHPSWVPQFNAMSSEQLRLSQLQGAAPQNSPSFFSGQFIPVQPNANIQATQGAPPVAGNPFNQSNYHTFPTSLPSVSNFQLQVSQPSATLPFSPQAPEQLRTYGSIPQPIQAPMSITGSQYNHAQVQSFQGGLARVSSGFDQQQQQQQQQQQRRQDPVSPVQSPHSPSQDALQRRTYTNPLERKIADLEARIKDLTMAQRSPSLHRTPSPPPPPPPPPLPPAPQDTSAQANPHADVQPMRQDRIPDKNSDVKSVSAEQKQPSQPETAETTVAPKASPEPPQGNSLKRFRMVVSKYEPGKDKRVEVEVEPPKSDHAVSVVTYRKYMDSQDVKRCMYEEVEIESDELKGLLSKSMLHVEEDFLEGAYTKAESPFEPFVFNWKRLVEEQDSRPEDTENIRNAREDLKYIMDAISISEPRKLKGYFRERDQYLAAGTITFAHLWTLFGWGTKIYARPFLEDWQMFEVKYNSGYRNSPEADYVEEDEPYDRYAAYDVYCSAYDWDGSNFKRYTYLFTIDKFEGRRPIKSLPCFPTEYYEDEHGRQDDSGLRAQLLERGKKFVELCTAEEAYALRRYSGPVLEVNLQRFKPRYPQYRYPIPVKRREIRDQDVIIDNSAFTTSQRNEFTGLSELPILGTKEARFDPADCPCRRCREGPTRIWPSKTFSSRFEEGEDFAVSGERLLLCPAKVLGYVPSNKIWAQFRIQHVREISEDAKISNESRFESQLELEKSTKVMLRALIRHHQARKDDLMQAGKPKAASLELDPIEGKGRGLAILLHGPPGVGKTLTAEAVALATGKPLLPVSVAEIGTEPPEAERRLMDVFADASRWNAVLLIDEADVFLEERVGFQDIKRNTLVSVLLRVLEYYDGIIILTTNRISSLDVAVQSRMHLAIQYTDLTKEQKFNIFQQFLDKVKHEIADRRAIDEYLNTICRKAALNGRQIRNIISSAQAMAHNEQRKLNKDHIVEIYEATEAFITCLKDLTTTKRARNEAVR